MMKKRSERRMWIAVGFVLLLLGLILIYFHIPYSPTRSEFDRLQRQWSSAAPAAETTVFTEADIVGLPLPVQRYFRHTGFIGSAKMTYMEGRFTDVAFRMGQNKPVMRIAYSQLNGVREPRRFALIEAAMFGIPFQGLDSYAEGTGAMKGVLAKAITLFNQQGPEMDQACLATYLAEALIVPAAALQPYIRWEAVDDLHAQATITYRDTTASGLFTFDEDGKMLSFKTNDRTAIATDGSMVHVPWSALCGDYRERNGLLQPASLQAVWHYPEGDLIYFDSHNAVFDFGY